VEARLVERFMEWFEGDSGPNQVLSGAEDITGTEVAYLIHVEPEVVPRMQAS
jgi:hypothetical protein